MVPETKGLSLEQVDQMLEETTPATSSTWVPRYTYADASARAEVAKATRGFRERGSDASQAGIEDGMEFQGFSTIVEDKR